MSDGPAMELTAAIRTRRTHKVYGAEPVDRGTIVELVELARWAPNHNLTQPWRFRVVGPRALDRLKAAGPAESASKLDRAPTLIAVSYVRDADPRVAAEDRDATAAATYALLLGAHARGLAAYWRTPGTLLEPAGRAALDVPDDEELIALVHLGPRRQDVREPERRDVTEILEFLA